MREIDLAFKTVLAVRPKCILNLIFGRKQF